MRKEHYYRRGGGLDPGLEVVSIAPMGAVTLADRLGLVDFIPALLAVSGLRRLFGRSSEVVARRPAA